MSDVNAVMPAGTRGELLQQIKDKAVVHGKVTLSSGLEADYYVDLRRITLDGEAAPLVGQVLLDLTEGLDYDAVGGLTMGADPVGTAMLHAAAARGRKLDSFVVRKAAKAHGLQRRVEGPEIKGRRVLVVEDTSTTGGSPSKRSRRSGRPAPRSSASPRSSTVPPEPPRRSRRAPVSRTSSPTPRTSWASTDDAPAGPRRAWGPACRTEGADHPGTSGKMGPTMTSPP